MSTTVKYLLIIVIGSLLFFPYLGQVHLFDWDEINFAECAREMILTDNYLQVQINFRPFWEKPPLFIWMQVLSMKAFGINDYAARFPNAFIGVLTLVSLFYVGKRIVNEKMAMWWVLIYAASWLPHFYFKSGIIDPLFNLLIFLAFFQTYLVKVGQKRSLHNILAGVFLGLAVLTKGPAAILIAILAFGVYIIINRGLKGYKILDIAIIALVALSTTSLWFGFEIINNGWWFVNEFIVYQIRLLRTQDAGHGGPFFYHFVILLLGCFPASVFLFQYSRKGGVTTVATKDFTRWMWIMFWVVLLLFSIVKTKIVHYSSLCYFPLTYLAALAAYKLAVGETKIKGIIRVLLLFIGSVVAIAITALPLIGINKEKLIRLIDDPFAVANLQADVSWSYTEAMWGILYLIGIWVAAYLLIKNFKKGLIALCVVQLIIIQVTVLHFTPKIEAFSQRAAIDFYEEFVGKDVYVHVLGYKSYAHYFYTKKQVPTNDKHDDEKWLLTGDIDKPAYFICKITAADSYRSYTQLEEIGEKNGFVFFKRK
ncbi:MAG: glycosyltransferase family 39 protein [Flavipsychrobacter sp.]